MPPPCQPAMHMQIMDIRNNKGTSIHHEGVVAPALNKKTNWKCARFRTQSRGEEA